MNISTCDVYVIYLLNDNYYLSLVYAIQVIKDDYGR